MTEYELAMVLSEYFSDIREIVATISTNLIAFMTASALAAQRLSRVLSIILLMSYSTLQMIVIFAFSRAGINIAGLAGKVDNTRSQDGSPIDWHGVAGLSESFMSVAFNTLSLIFTVIFLGSLYFFYLCRRGEFRLER